MASADTVEESAAHPRLEYWNVAPKGVKGMLELEKYVHSSSLDPKILELVKMRASQLNGCAYCLDMHSKDARARGESEQRLYVLPAWRETGFYSPAERAALAWCEALTLISERGAPSELYEDLERHFSGDEIAALTFAIVAINGWNRLAIGFSAPVGDYESPYGKESPDGDRN